MAICFERSSEMSLSRDCSQSGASALHVPGMISRPRDQPPWKVQKQPLSATPSTWSPHAGVCAPADTQPDETEDEALLRHMREQEVRTCQLPVWHICAGLSEPFVDLHSTCFPLTPFPPARAYECALSTGAPVCLC